MSTKVGGKPTFLRLELAAGGKTFNSILNIAKIKHCRSEKIGNQCKVVSWLGLHVHMQAHGLHCLASAQPHMDKVMTHKCSRDV